jgi:hypothetical protein
VRCYKVYLFPAASVAPPYGPRTRSGHVYPKVGGCSSARTYPPSRRAGYWSKAMYRRIAKNERLAYDKRPGAIPHYPAEADTLSVVDALGHTTAIH